jgi:cardiolipin synthase
MENPCQKKIITIPNLLSAFRIALIPALIWTYIVKKDDILTLGLLLLSGLTDIADGWIARTFHMVSDFGKILDPIADKLTQIAMLFCLTFRFQHLLAALILLILKELCSSVMGLFAIKYSGQVLGAEWHGKATTVLIYTTITLHLLWIDIPPIVSDVLLLLCVGMMLVSAVLYFRRSQRQIVQGKAELS